MDQVVPDSQAYPHMYINILAKSQVKTLLNMSQIEVSKLRRIRNCPGKLHVGRPAGRPMCSRSVDRSVDRSPAHPPTRELVLKYARIICPSVDRLGARRSTGRSTDGTPGRSTGGQKPGHARKMISLKSRFKNIAIAQRANMKNYTKHVYIIMASNKGL